MITEENKPLVIEKYADNGMHSHYELIDPKTGELLWSQIEEDEQRQEVVPHNTVVSSTTDEPDIDFVTQRMTLNEDGTEDIDIECRFVDGQKFAAITVDGEFPNLAQRISDFLNGK